MFRPIEIQRVGPQHADALGRFFDLLSSRKSQKFFHPHPLTVEAARERASYKGKDLYYILVEGEEVLGYGLLRGWDEGYEIPSLGIAIHPNCQGQGFGRLLMEFLRIAALRRGANQIRLRVHAENHAALRLYSALGFKIGHEKDGPSLVGFLDLNSASETKKPSNVSHSDRSLRLLKTNEVA